MRFSGLSCHWSVISYHSHVEQVGQVLGMVVARETSLAGRVKDIFKWGVALLRTPTRLEVPPAP